MKFTLVHKGLILVSIPLCFEVIIFALLLNLQVQLEQETQRIDRNRKINDAVNSIVREIVDVTYTVDRFTLWGGSASVTRQVAHISDCMSRASSKIQLLKGLVKDDPKLARKADQAFAGILMARQDLTQLGWALRHSSTEEIPSVLIGTKRKLGHDIYMSIGSGVLEIGDETLKGTSDATSRRMREESRLLLKCALALSVVVGLSGALIFNKGLSARLKKLGVNAGRLAHGEPLLEPVGGSDEVAELDRNFHHAATLIESAKRMRQEVTAMITHDLKTPLQSIRSYLEMLEAGLFGSLNDQGARLLGTTQAASEQMVGLIDSVLQLEKLRTGSLQLQSQVVDLVPLLKTCLELVGALAEGKQVTLSAPLDDDAGIYVLGDAFWLKEVFVNILSNAIKFSPERSTVTVTTRQSGEQVKIAFADQGPGIKEEDRELIFERFHRVKSTSAVAGSGLGLSIAKELIGLHNGTIKVESEAGEGSTFVVLLPLCKAPKVRGGD